MRGALVQVGVQVFAVGIIPADAGSTFSREFSCFASWDHPRGCGEHTVPDKSLGARSGSSPRMRGALRMARSISLPQWIIPADAGSTPTSPRSAPAMKDHPRGCGEHSAYFSRCVAALGSSPRMRGAHRVPVGQCCESGIIPADAGSTVAVNVNCRKFKDHPRGCGEHCCKSSRLESRYGSSPRMRGALGDALCECMIDRIIPADAGSTGRPTPPVNISADHPRGCGEHDDRRPVQGEAPGSSPRMRGALGEYTRSW